MQSVTCEYYIPPSLVNGVVVNVDRDITYGTWYRFEVNIGCQNDIHYLLYGVRIRCVWVVRATLPVRQRPRVRDKRVKSIPRSRTPVIDLDQLLRVRFVVVYLLVLYRYLLFYASFLFPERTAVGQAKKGSRPALTYFIPLLALEWCRARYSSCRHVPGMMFLSRKGR